MEQLTTVERALASIATLGRLVDRRLASEILATPVPDWPPRFPSRWEPTPSGPSYAVEVETARLLLRQGNTPRDDPRSITLRVVGSPSRRANDWAGFRVRFSGTALPRAVLVFADQDDPIIALFGGGTGVVLWVRSVDVFHDDVATVHGHADWAATPLLLRPVQDGPKPPTKGDLKLIERGGTLLTRMPTTMTARGKPGSGHPQDRRRDCARKLLTNAGHDLLNDDPPSSITAINLGSALGRTERAVYQMLERAAWGIADVQHAANSLHTG